MRRPKAPSSLVSSARGVVAQGSVVFGRKGNTDGGFMLDPIASEQNILQEPSPVGTRNQLDSLFAGLTLVDLR